MSSDTKARNKNIFITMLAAMKKNFLFLLFLFFVSIGFAQTTVGKIIS